MSVQFGRWHFEGESAAAAYLEKVSSVLSPYGPDGKTTYAKAGVDVLYFAFHSTNESSQEVQPRVLESGAILTWDGRLDNRAELLALLRDSFWPDNSDLSIVAAGYERWGTECFAKLIGDWALSLWSSRDHSLILAKDPVGTRQLFYSVAKDQVTWCTLLEPFVLFAERTPSLDEEYLAGWFSFFPSTRLTPYTGIHSVPPSSFVLIEPGVERVRRYWSFDPQRRISYRTDSEYEEHFRTVFAEAVRRRLRCRSTVLAELSGGMDSSSIVCMADAVIAREPGAHPHVETVSYYDDSEPNWDERPYFAKVEEQRGRVGRHIDAALPDAPADASEAGRLATSPGSSSPVTTAAKKYALYIRTKGFRVVLSGIGGDEMVGGVPTPIPELADLLAAARLDALARQLKSWALQSRRPWLQLLVEAIKVFLPPALAGVPKYLRAPAWLNTNFVKRNRAALRGYHSRVKFFGPRPSFQEAVSTLDALRRQLAGLALPCEPCYEKRYPYLDRDLLEFILAVPREQLIRPGQRRSLMRRALSGIVPNEVLQRRRKAFLSAAPTRAVSAQSLELAAASTRLVCADLEIVDPRTFRLALHEVSHGQVVPVVALMRTIGIEFWLRSVRNQGIADGIRPAGTKDYRPFAGRGSLEALPS